MTIDPEIVEKKQGVYKYITLSGEMLNVEVKIRYKDASIKAFLRYIPEMDYPLMFVGD